MSSRSLILTYDIGTTGNKCSVFDERGQKLWSVVMAYDTIYPQPGWSEQRPDDFWASVINGTKVLIEDYGLDPKDVAVIGLSGHMNGCIPMDMEGQVLYNNIIHSDCRTGEECRNIQDIFSSQHFYNITGNRIDPHYTLPKVLWLKKHHPDIYKNTAYFLNTKDYMVYKLTGKLGITDYSDASLTCMLDIRTKKWSKELVEGLGIDINKLPRLKGSYEIAGGLSRDAAKILGLKEGTPVAVGGGDGACATKGAGVIEEGMAYNYIGSSSWISTMTKSPILDDGARIFNFCDLDGVHYNVTGTVQCATISYDWVIENLGKYEMELVAKGHGDIFQLIQEVAEGSPIGSRGVFFLPYLMGERTPYWDENTRGGFIGITLFHDRKDLFRSVYEGIAYALRSVLDVFEENQIDIKELNLIGGGAKSSLWNEIMCNVFNRPISVHPHPGEATSLGTAIAAGVGVGIFKSFKEAKDIIRFNRRLEPDSEAVAQYEKYYKIYKMMYPSLKSIYEAIASLN